MIDRLIATLTAKSENPALPDGCYFSRVREFIGIANKHAERWFNLRSDHAFDFPSFVAKTCQPLIAKLIVNIREAFTILPEL